MAERDETPIEVELDRSRPYRANDEHTEAIWVGPGKVKVPRWVADEWGLTTPPIAPTTPTGGATGHATPAPAVPRNAPPNVGAEPFADYDELAATDIVERLPSLTAQQRDAVRAYETANRGRKTILNALAETPERGK